jgi:hypothetical protein
VALHATVPTMTSSGIAATNTTIAANRSPATAGVSTVSSKAAGVYFSR